MKLADVHAHLTDHRLLPNVQQIVERAAAAGLSTILCNGLNPHDNQAVADLAQRFPMIKPCFGLYPVDAVLVEMLAAGIDYPHDRTPQPAEEAIAWLEEHLDEAVAIGEIGLDHYWVPESLWERQEEVFRKLISLAMAADKPMIIHTRKAERRCLEILTEMGAKRVNWHCFSGKVKFARQIAAAGHWLSIPANVTRAQNFQRMVQTLPRDKLLLETDCPYLPPVRDTLNEPATVRGTAEYVAEQWQISLQGVSDQLASNFEALMGFSP